MHIPKGASQTCALLTFDDALNCPQHDDYDAARWLYVPLYLLLGWAAIMYMVPLFQANVAMMVLVIIGGLLYSVGAVVYGIKKPNPWPGHFGFHEIFHTLTVLAFLCHWTAALLLALNPFYLR